MCEIKDSDVNQSGEVCCNHACLHSADDDFGAREVVDSDAEQRAAFPHARVVRAELMREQDQRIYLSLGQLLSVGARRIQIQRPACLVGWLRHDMEEVSCLFGPVGQLT
eukprot:2102813-Rhodomonas_salina.1